MGAAGIYYLCPTGHVVYRLQDHMGIPYYNRMANNVRKDPFCSYCGYKIKYGFSHYGGGLLDCWQGSGPLPRIRYIFEEHRYAIEELPHDGLKLHEVKYL